jgi:hypothetical protein
VVAQFWCKLAEELSGRLPLARMTNNLTIGCNKNKWAPLPKARFL